MLIEGINCLHPTIESQEKRGPATSKKTSPPPPATRTYPCILQPHELNQKDVYVHQKIMQLHQQRVKNQKF